MNQSMMLCGENVVSGFYIGSRHSSQFPTSSRFHNLAFVSETSGPFDSPTPPPFLLQICPQVLLSLIINWHPGQRQVCLGVCIFFFAQTAPTK